MTLPPDYLTIRAARYLRVAPWDLLQQSAYWTFAALAAQEAETRAANIVARRSQSK